MVDVIADLAFLVMDLHHRGKIGTFVLRCIRMSNLEESANLLLDRYISNTGDYDGLRVLNFYLVYRAIVRVSIIFFTT